MNLPQPAATGAFPRAVAHLFSLDHIVTQYELESLWVKSALPGIVYTFDTRVRAVAGEHVGRTGRVVALLSIDPSPLYVIEEPEDQL